MMNDQSHGRLKISLFRVSTALAVPAIVCFGIGAMAGLFTRHTTTVNPTQNTRVQEVQAQIRMLSQTARIALDKVKAEAIQIADSSSISPASPILQTSPILQLIKVDLAEVAGVRNFADSIKGVLGAPVGPDKISPQTMAAIAIKGKKSFAQNSKNEIAITLIRPFMAVIVKASGTNSNATNYNAGNYNAIVAIVEPRRVFSEIRSMDQRTQGGDIRAMIVSDDGYVITHSQEVYDQSDIAEESIFTQLVRPVFSQASASAMSEYTAVDRLQVTAAAEKIEGLPLALVIERTRGDESFLGFITEDGTFQSIFGRLMVMAGLMILAVVMFSEVFRRRANQILGIETLGIDNSLATSPVSTQAPKSHVIRMTDERIERAMATLNRRDSELERQEMNVVETTLRRELQTTQAALQNLRDENSLLGNFEMESLRVRDPGQVAQRAVQTAHRLCQSPAVFFSYQEQRKSCAIYAAAGIGASELGQPFSIQVEEDLLTRILANEIQGSLTSLNDYEPLSQKMLSQLGVAHFEAWAVTGFGHLGRQTQKPRLLGILVLLNAGTESLAKRDSVRRVLRSTGLIYENTLLSR